MTAAGAAAAWRDALAAWALPPDLLDAAPEDPYTFDRSTITHATVDPRETPTGRAVAEVLAPGERLLDVGVGAGRIAGPLAEVYDVHGVEPNASLAEIAAARGISVHAGRWPAAAEADEVDGAPVVLSTHVAYDVAELGPFLRALHEVASRRVVVEVTERHPWVHLGPLYRRFQHLDRPAGPDADLLRQVVEETTGCRPVVVRWRRPGAAYADLEALLTHTRRMLCLHPDADRDAALRAALRTTVQVAADGRAVLPDARLVTMWWDVAAGG